FDATERLLREYDGECPVQLLVQTPGDVLLTLELGERWRVHPARTLLEALAAIWGPRAVVTRSRQLLSGGAQ
ncbi:MAG: hypothetical protein ACYTF0_07835, partial [Planctomycetota bacterium]